MDILINVPKEVFTTYQEFISFSYYEVAAFFCNWKICFHKNEDGSIKMWTHNKKLVYKCIDSRRFIGINWFENSSAEVYNCTIPKDNNLIKIIESKLKYLFLQ